MGANFEISMGGDGQLRKAFRTRVPGLTARISSLEESFEVKDLSATGFAVVAPKKAIREGQPLEVDLLIKNKVFLRGLTAEAVRVLDNGIVGINFTNLPRQQQAKLDKLVLEVQKRLIALRKKQRERE